MHFSPEWVLLLRIYGNYEIFFCHHMGHFRQAAADHGKDGHFIGTNTGSRYDRPVSIVIRVMIGRIWSGAHPYFLQQNIYFSQKAPTMVAYLYAEGSALQDPSASLYSQLPN
jgi:hypothetical protein